MFISSHEIEHSFSNEAQRLVYRRLRCCTKRRLCHTRSVADSHLVHSSTLISPSFLHSSHNCQNNTILLPLTIFVITAHICTMMMQFDHDKFLPLFVKLSTSPYCTNISSQYDGTQYNGNSQHGARYNSTECTPLPLPGESQRTYLSTINVHNDRLIDSAHFAQPMSYDSTYTSPSIAHVCSDRPADSTRIVSYIRRQYARTVPNVVIVGSTPRFNYVLATNSNPVTTCALDGRVNPYPNTCTTSTRTRRALVVPGTVGGHLYFELAWCEVFISIRRRDS
jgi:hypothetical protein